ncbi:ABC transporter ATP-binding protein [Geothrix campi]|uniref:ABC transporter ATP-binding protein n=1 Tax=Geothrix campi TaxID=2966450 RepID=UPI002147BEAB|nr:ATP-binding cassette domain-containing protein [Geothrix sp. SG10]
MRLQRMGKDIIRDVSFAIAQGEALGVAGASAAGKTTLLNLVLGLLEPTEGQILLEGAPWSPLPERERRLRRPRIQAVFQDPQASLPPHRTGWEILQEPLEIWNRGTDMERREAAARMAARVKFPEAALEQRPSAWSGGLAQRLCLGRALMLEPALLVLDEPFSAVDPTLAGHLMALLLDLKAAGTALLFVSHDLASVRVLCDRLLVLQSGRPLCQGAVEPLLSDPPHPHLGALMASSS